MNLIRHVAIIMDGNGRWGIKKRNSRNYGHSEGLKVVENIIKYSIVYKIPYLTLFTFSTENWKRPDNEINFLFALIKKFFKRNLKKITKQGIKVSIIGKKNKLPKTIRQIINKVEKNTKKNNKIHVVLALNYGSKEEIINACKKFVRKKIKRITNETFQKALYTSNLPNPDLLIRTGGNRRLSNFLLWQLAYTEIFFTNTMWPDFNTNKYKKILEKFKKIKRNYGAI